VEERKAYNTLKERTQLLEECRAYTKGNTIPLQLVYPLEIRSSESKRTQPVREENVVEDEKDSHNQRPTKKKQPGNKRVFKDCSTG
jgi:hypothetical protein